MRTLCRLIHERSARALLVATLLAPISMPAQLLRLEHAFVSGDPVTFGVVQDATVAPNGEVVILDLAHVRVYRFAPNGTLRDSLGGRGGGPGELRSPAGIARLGDGGVVVFDNGQGRAFWYAADGTPRGVARLAGRIGFDVREWRSGSVLLKTQDFRTGMLVFTEVRPGTDTAGPPLFEVTFTRAGWRTTGPTCEFCAWASAPGGGIVVAASDTAYRITRIDSTGRAGRTWSRAVPPRPRSDADLAALKVALARGPAGTGRPEGASRTMTEIPRFEPRVGSLGVDHRGRLWVLARNGDERGPVLDVFDSSGVHLTTVRPREQLDRMRVVGDRIVGWGEGANGEPEVWRYRIVE